MRATKSAVRQQSRLILGISALACMMGATDAAAAAYAEFESFHLAVVSRDKDAARAFIDAFPSSPLIDDLFVMLPPEVARDVCADLPGGGTAAQDACRKSDMPIGPREFAESGMGDDAISPAAGADARRQQLASARSRPAGTTGERPAGSIARILPPSSQDSPAASDDDNRTTQTARKEAVEAPKARREAAPPAPRLGSDPGSDPGSASSPSSQGGDPGSDPGSGSGGDAGRDSHN
jgi:hypothetical protein